MLSKNMGVVGSRWAPRSSKPVAGRVAGRGGFDSHPLPPYSSNTNISISVQQFTIIMAITYTQVIDPSPPPDPYLQLINKVFNIEEVTWGNEKQNFIVRYRGKLLLNSQDAYQQLSNNLDYLDVTPLFRMEDGREVIVLLKGIVRPKPSNPWINLILFILTGISVVFAGTFFEYQGPLTTDLNQLLPHLSANSVSRFGICRHSARNITRPRVWTLPGCSLPPLCSHTAILYSLPLQPIRNHGSFHPAKKNLQRTSGSYWISVLLDRWPGW